MEGKGGRDREGQEAGGGGRAAFGGRLSRQLARQ